MIPPPECPNCGDALLDDYPGPLCWKCEDKLFDVPAHIRRALTDSGYQPDETPRHGTNMSTPSTRPADTSTKPENVDTFGFSGTCSLCGELVAEGAPNPHAGCVR